MDVCLATLIIIFSDLLSLVVYGIDIDPLCNCYSVSLNSISGISSDHTICYNYAIKLNSENKQCQYNALDMVLGVCDVDDVETQFTSNSLQESIVSITPNQDISIPYQSTDSFFGLKLKINPQISNELTLCMNNINTNGATSNNVQFILENNDIITCHNDPNQSGLPCKSSTAPIIESQQNIDYVAKYIEKDNGFGDLEFDRIDISDNFNIGPITNDNDINKGTNNVHKTPRLKGISVTTRSYIKFAFVAIMIFIGLNAIFCVLLTLRQSGALDNVKYFNSNNDHDVDKVDDIHNITNIDMNMINETDEDADDENNDDNSSDDMDDNYLDNDFSPIINQISFRDLVAMRNGHFINESNLKIMMSLSKLEENLHSNSDSKHSHSKLMHSQFIE